MKHPDIIRLEEIFKRHLAPAPRLSHSSDSLPSPGQLWTLAQFSPGNSFNEVVVLGHPNKEDGLETVDVAPLVHDATLAGPMDYILPENVFCHHATVLLSLSFSLPQRKLGACVGTVEESLWKDMLAHCDKAQANELDPGERHAPAYFDVQDARYRFHEEAAGQIAALQKELYQWLDQLEESGEWTVPEAPVIKAAHLFKEVAPVFGMAAAGDGAPDSLKEFPLPFQLDGQPMRLTVRQSVKQGFLALVLHGDRKGRCSQVLAENGKKLADIVKGEARFEWTEQVGGALILADAAGNPLVKIKVQ